MLDARDLGRVVAVFDWEMSALGDPLVDLGILLGYWVHTATGGQRDALSSITHGRVGSRGSRFSSVTLHAQPLM